VVDIDIAAADNTLADVRARLENNQALLFAKRKLERTKKQDSEVGSRQSDLDADAKSYSEKIADIEGKLYSGAIKNPRELSAYQEEQEQFKKHQVEVEERLLGVMLERDKAQHTLKETEEEVARLERERSQEKSQLTEEKERLEQHLEASSQRREAAADKVPSVDLSIYEKLTVAKNGVAVSKVERGICMGCRITLPTKELQQARAGQSLVMCNSCDRILYVSG